MLSFSRYTTEALNRPLPWEWTEQSQGRTGKWDAAFTIPDTNPPSQYTVSFQFIQKTENGSKWYLDFRASRETSLKYAKTPYRTFGVLGNTKSEFKVFATVLDVIRAFIKKQQPLQIVFSGSGETRNKLYQRLVATYQHSIPGYEMGLGKKFGGEQSYVIMKNGSPSLGDPSQPTL